MDAAYLNCDYVGWHNWIIHNQSKFPDKGNLTVYYDSSFVHKGLELSGNQTNGSWKYQSWTAYYLNGKKMNIWIFDPRDSVYTEIHFTIRGDTMRMTRYGPRQSFRDEKNWTENRQNPSQTYVSWIAHYEGKSYYSFGFNEKGDTLRKMVVKDGKLVGNAYDNMNPRMRYSVTADSLGRPVTKYIPEKTKAEITSLVITFKDSLKLDSLAEYQNLLDVSIRMEKMSPGTFKKLDKLASLPRLESIALFSGASEFPGFILKCKNLKRLTLDDTKIRLIPASIVSLGKLYFVSLSGNMSMDYETSLKNLSLLPSLHELLLPLDFGKPLPKNIVLLKGLWHLSIGDYTVCTKDTSPSFNINLIYQLKQLRQLEVCYDQFYKIDHFSFAAKMPGCRISQYETCFSGDTKLLMANGNEKAISEISEGDIVLCPDDSGAGYDTTVVTRLFFHHEPMEGLLNFILEIPGETDRVCLSTTAIHPFFANGEWKKAAELCAGDELQYCSPEGRKCTAVVKEITRSPGSGAYVYNIRTSRHTFFAGGILVHNK